MSNLSLHRIYSCSGIGWFLLAFLALVLSACGGGGGGGGGTVITLQGSAQKGPYIADGLVTAYRLDPVSGQRTNTTVNGVTNALGEFQLAAITWTGLTEIVVVGRYYNEASNSTSVTPLSMSAIIDVQGNATIRLNFFTHLVAGRIRELMDQNTPFAQARSRALAELAEQFDLDLSGGIGPESLNVLDGTGPNRQDNANLLLISTALLSAGTDTQAELDQIRDAYADSGRLDQNSFNSIAAAADAVDLNLISNNLETNYGIQNAPDVTDLPGKPAWIYGYLNDTGIRSNQCHTLSGAALASCASADALALAATQDGMLGRDSDASLNSNTDGAGGFSYTRLGADGQPLAIQNGLYSESGNEVAGTKWSCVRDNVTGLIWEAKADSGIRDKTTTYSYANLAAYVSSINSARLCGYEDWKLPTPQESASMLDNGKSSGVRADQMGFPLQQAAGYWTAHSVIGGDGASAWYVDFSTGLVAFANKSATLYARLVRSALPKPITRYTQGAGVVTDHLTGLMWRVGGVATANNWKGALQYAATVNADANGLGLGYSNWRLPNRNELGSIMDYSKNGPALDAVFSSLGNSSYWTSTPYVDGATHAWYVTLLDGGHGPDLLAESLRIVLVRDD